MEIDFGGPSADLQRRPFSPLETDDGAVSRDEPAVGGRTPSVRTALELGRHATDRRHAMDRRHATDRRTAANWRLAADRHLADVAGVRWSR